MKQFGVTSRKMLLMFYRFYSNFDVLGIAKKF